MWCCVSNEHYKIAVITIYNLVWFKNIHYLHHITTCRLYTVNLRVAVSEGMHETRPFQCSITFFTIVIEGQVRPWFEWWFFYTQVRLSEYTKFTFFHFRHNLRNCLLSISVRHKINDAAHNLRDCLLSIAVGYKPIDGWLLRGAVLLFKWIYRNFRVANFLIHPRITDCSYTH